MSLPNTNILNIDPDYILPEINEATKLNEEPLSVSAVNAIIDREFKQELDIRQKQINLIQKRAMRVSKMLHLIRYVLVNSYYNNFETTLQEVEENSYHIPEIQSRIHPAIKKLLGRDQQLQILNKKRQIQKPVDGNFNQVSVELSLKALCRINSDVIPREPNNIEINDYTKDAPNIHQNDNKESQRSASIIRNRVLTRLVIIVGNISKYIPSRNPHDKLVHKWMVYVRGPKESPNIDGVVHKVVFYLHPSYKPNDIVEVEEHPFHLTRRGWGEFPLRVRIYFKDNYNKPVDIIHNLRLDKTYVGRQILGSETVAQVNLYDATESSNYFKDGDKIENDEIMQNMDNFEDKILVNKRIKMEKYDSQNDLLDHLLVDEQLDIDKFLINNIDIDENIKHESCDHFSSEYNLCPFNNDCCSRNNISFDISELQQNIDVEHSYSKYTITNGIKRKLSEIPILDYKRIKPEICISKNEDVDTSNYIKIYDMKRLRTTIQMISLLLRNMPLLTDLAHDPNYKSIFPYSARNLQEYRSWNIAKRQASEWGRARMIRNLIVETDLPNCTKWSTKKIVLFARAYGFTPLSNYKPFRNLVYQQHLTDLKSPSLPRIDSPVIYDNFQVDITNNSANDLQMNGFTKSKISLNNSLTKKYGGFVKEAALEMGVLLRDDEIVTGIYHNTSETILLKAVMCFAEDLLRCARADAVYKGQLRNDEGYIHSENVRNALNKYREEFICVTTFNKYSKLF